MLGVRRVHDSIGHDLSDHDSLDAQQPSGLRRGLGIDKVAQTAPDLPYHLIQPGPLDDLEELTPPELRRQGLRDMTRYLGIAA